MDSSNTSNTSHVAVIACEDTDKQLMTQLLEKAGYSAGVFDSVDSVAASQAEHSAIIFCHRESTALNAAPQSENTSTIDLPTVLGLPSVREAQRVVVFSNSPAEETIVTALEQGAHHFFDLSESPQILQARLEAALRQHSIKANRILDVAPFKFNLERRNVYKDSKLISLSPKEYEFAYYLFANRHRVVINSELMTSVWSLPSSMDARRIDTAACRVRKKMQLSDASSGWCLRRIRRVGYELLWHGDQEVLSHQVESQAPEVQLPEPLPVLAETRHPASAASSTSAATINAKRRAQEQHPTQVSEVPSASIAASNQAREIA